jgi:septum formation protein
MEHLHPQLVLASNSPRRRELLRQAGYRFQVRPPPIDDADVDVAGLAPAVCVEHLALVKAESAVAAGRIEGAQAIDHAPSLDVSRLLEGALVLGADTVVALNGRIIGKPDDEADARRILADLSGSQHEVLTGLALIDMPSGRRFVQHDITRVRMRVMTTAEIDAYVDSGEAMGKAGAYAIQETGDRYIESLEGSMTNVVGLPMQLLERMLKAAGYDPGAFRE